MADTLRAFTTAFVKFIYFTSSKINFSTLAINIYNIPHILLFILQYKILKYYKIFLFFIFYFIPPTSTHTEHSEHTQIQPTAYKTTPATHTHAGNPYPRRFFPHASNP